MLWPSRSNLTARMLHHAKPRQLNSLSKPVLGPPIHINVMFDEHKPTPNRPRHQVVRSITDSSSPKLIGHILRHKQERGHHGSQPDLRPSGSQAEVRSEWNTPERSLNPSRRPSLLANAADGHESAKMATSLRSERRPVKDGEVEEEKGKTVLMAALVPLAVMVTMLISAENYGIL